MNEKDRLEAAYLAIGRNMAKLYQLVEERVNGGAGQACVRAEFCDRYYVFVTRDKDLADSMMELTTATGGPDAWTEIGTIEDGEIVIDPPNRD